MSDEKTEQPTPKRLRDIREKGQVAKSQDVPSALTVMAVAVYFLAMAPDMLRTLLTLGEIPMRIMNLPLKRHCPWLWRPRCTAPCWWPGRSSAWS